MIDIHIKYYEIDGVRYDSIEDIRKSFPTILIPQNPNKEQLDFLGITEKEEVIAPQLSAVKEEKLKEIKKCYLEAVYDIVWVDNEDGTSYGYDTDKESQVDFSLSYTRARDNGTTHYNVYVDKDDLSKKSFIAHTPLMFKKALDSAGEYQEKVYANYYAKKFAVNEAVSREEVESIYW